MSVARQVKKCLAVCSLGAAALVAALPTHAIVINGSWDPWYGTPFVGADSNATTDDMWWNGTAQFVISDECTITFGQLLTSSECADMKVTSATVNLTLGDGGSVLSTLQFTDPAQTAAVTGVFFNLDGTVRYITSNWFNPMQRATDPSSSGWDLSSYFFTVSFDEQGPRLFHAKDDAYLDSHGSHGPDEKTFFWNGEGLGHKGELCGPDSGMPDGEACGFSDQYRQATYTIAAIPEPSTYSLIIAGLAAVGFMARRRRLQA